MIMLMITFTSSSLPARVERPNGGPAAQSSQAGTHRMSERGRGEGPIGHRMTERQRESDDSLACGPAHDSLV